MPMTKLPRFHTPKIPIRKTEAFKGLAGKSFACLPDCCSWSLPRRPAGRVGTDVSVVSFEVVMGERETGVANNSW